MITVRRIRSGEADLLKQVRLASLQDAPYAFGAAYDLVSQRSDEDWREKAESTANGCDGATFFVFSEEVPIGMAALFRIEGDVLTGEAVSKGQTEVGELIQVWVAAEYRGTSAAWDLMNAIFKWAGENNFLRIIAGVTKGNVRAQQIYIKYGFSIMDKSSSNDSGGVYLEKQV